MSKSIIIRTDANHFIGMGHIMRCLSIADAFSSIGNVVRFILADDTVLPFVYSRGYECIVLNSDYDKMEEELVLWPEINEDFIIVDSYYITPFYLHSLQKLMNNRKICKLIYIDDIGAFPYPVDILVNYNVYGPELNYHGLYSSSEVEEPSYILGPQYVPIRSMFRGLARKIQKQKVNNILISTGGSDELHLTIRILQFLLAHERYNQTFHILIGALNTDKSTIKELVKRKDSIILYENVDDMRSLIEKMDLVISAAGSTLYEVCACGVPLITYSLANNQIPGSKAFERLGLAVNAGDLRDPSTINHSVVMTGELRQDAAETLFSLMNICYEDRCRMGKKMQDVIDGNGADRLIKRILDNKT